MTKLVSSMEAAANFDALLRAVEQGESIVIMREGSPIAELRPAVPKDEGDLAGVFAAMRAERAQRDLGAMTLRELIEEGLMQPSGGPQ